MILIKEFERSQVFFEAYPVSWLLLQIRVVVLFNIIKDSVKLIFKYFQMFQFFILMFTVTCILDINFVNSEK